MSNKIANMIKRANATIARGMALLEKAQALAGGEAAPAKKARKDKEAPAKKGPVAKKAKAAPVKKDKAAPAKARKAKEIDDDFPDF